MNKDLLIIGVIGVGAILLTGGKLTEPLARKTSSSLTDAGFGIVKGGLTGIGDTFKKYSNPAVPDANYFIKLGKYLKN